ncbi:unnamed protein product [Amoebophrya sp. A25]|nr:unnamed protein product [Amoebophrya sp. A25]|eukprot:GSA25T00014756001.1
MNDVQAASSRSLSAAGQGTSGPLPGSTLFGERPPPKKTLSDVLARAGRGESFESWKKTIVELDSDEIARRQAQQGAICSRKLAMAQVNAWSTLAKLRCGGSSCSVGSCNFPLPLKNLVSDFLGEQIQQLSALAAERAHAVSRGSRGDSTVASDALEKRRSADRLQAVNYYFDYIHTQAAQGVHRVPITTEICAAAPKMSTGEPVRLDIVVQSLVRQASYRVVDAHDEVVDYENMLLDPTVLPLFVRFGRGESANQESSDRALSGMLKLEYEQRNSARGLAGRPSGVLQERGYMSTLQKVVKQTQMKAAEFLLQRFRQCLALGYPTLEVTSDLVQGPHYPKLPNGNVCPLSLARLRTDLHESLHIFGDYLSLFRQLHTVANKSTQFLENIELRKADTDGGALMPKAVEELSRLADPLPFTICVEIQDLDL